MPEMGDDDPDRARQQAPTRAVRTQRSSNEDQPASEEDTERARQEEEQLDHPADAEDDEGSREASHLGAPPPADVSEDENTREG